MSGDKTETLSVDQQIAYGTDHGDPFSAIIQIDAGGIQTITFGVHCPEFDVDSTMCVFFARILTALRFGMAIPPE